MFQFDQIQNEPVLKQGQTVLASGIGLEVSLHDGRVLQLGLRELAGSCLTFAAEGDAVTAVLRLREAGGAAAVEAEVTVSNTHLFRDRVSLSPKAGVRIRIRELPGMEGLMASYQHKDWWTRPHFNTDLRLLPDRTLSLLWRTGAYWAHLLPVCGSVFRGDLCGNADGMQVQLSAYQDGFAECRTLAFVISSGAAPHSLAETSTAAALQALDTPAVTRKEKRYPEVLDYVGWCSWDAFYEQVDAAGLLEKTKELADMGLPVRWVMIDDGWSEVSEDKRLRSYDAVPSKFPGGLAAVIREMKERHGIRWVGVWHTIAGYWGGIDPQGELFARNRERLIRTNGGAWVPKPDAAAAFGFWNDWHGYLKKQGVDFVKVDSQSAVANFLSGHAPIGAAAEAAHTALEASVGLHFDGCVINCMGMAGENIWHRPASAVSRNSDDFVPAVDASFREHALQNAYNSYFHSPFYWGDWDMYWTDHHDDKQNMVLRAVSGGPVYFSDKTGQTKPEHVWPLIYRDGRIIRCDQPGQPTADCLTVDPVSEPMPLKIWNRIGSAGVLAAFHIHEHDVEVEGSISPADVPGLVEQAGEGGAFIVYEATRRQALRLKADERHAIRLQPSEAALYLVLREQPAVTPIGLVHKLLSADAVLACRTAGKQTTVSLKEGGVFAFAAAKQPEAILVNGREASWTSDAAGGLILVDCGDSAEQVIVDIVL